MLSKLLTFICMIAISSIPSASLASTSDIGKLLDSKMEQASLDLTHNKNIPQAWQILDDISKIIKSHPEYDDGEYAEGMIDLVSNILTKPWKYTAPYLIGNKTSPLLQQFLVGHINDLTPPDDLRKIRHIISKNCDQHKYKICWDLMAASKINK